MPLLVLVSSFAITPIGVRLDDPQSNWQNRLIFVSRDELLESKFSAARLRQLFNTIVKLEREYVQSIPNTVVHNLVLNKPAIVSYLIRNGQQTVMALSKVCKERVVGWKSAGWHGYHADCLQPA